MMRFGIDVDSVVANTVGEMISRLNGKFGCNLCVADVTDYYIDGWLRGSPEMAALRDAWIYDGAFYSALPVLEGAREAVAELQKLGPCYFITARPLDLHGVTVEWLAAQLFPADIPVICNEEKAKVATQLGLTHFVEDSPKQALALAQAGLTVYLMDYGWNRHVPDGPCGTAADGGERELAGAVVRVSGWDDLLWRLGVSSLPRRSSVA